MRELARGARIVTASVGDHPLVLGLLAQALQATPTDDFQSRLDEPGYRPSNRLLLRQDTRLLGHVHLASHIAWFEGQRMPIVNFEDFAVLPEHCDSEQDIELLAAAEDMAAIEGAVIGLAHTERGEWFERQGWSAWRGQGHTRANARTLLAHLDPQENGRRRKRAGIEVRLWRHYELDSVRHIYATAASRLWGPLCRSEEYWQWLVGRKVQDQILVAVQRGASSDKNGIATVRLAQEPAIGYAMIRGSALVEMMTLPHCSGARVQLLAAACREAIDRDHNAVAVYTPATDPLHELLVTAGGRWISDRISRSPRWVMRLLSPERWVDRCYELYRTRAQDAGVARPLEFGIAAGDATYRFALTRRSARLEVTASLPSDWIACERPVFEQLLTGDLAIGRAVTEGRLKLSHAALESPLTAVFAPRLFWQSSLELSRP